MEAIEIIDEMINEFDSSDSRYYEIQCVLRQARERIENRV